VSAPRAGEKRSRERDALAASDTSDEGSEWLISRVAAARTMASAAMLAYLMWMPLMAREMTSRWISDVPSKIV
jgi:hypothetical protein